MPTWDSLAAFARDLKGWEVELTEIQAARITKAQAVEAQRIADRQAASVLGGDLTFSGWTRARPIRVSTRVGALTDGHIITPRTKSAAGPWTVLEFGRNSVAGPRLTGPRLTKTGRISRRRVKRYNGRTAGRGVASKASVEMDRKLPPIADKAVLRIARKRFDVT